ncbi:carbohydrate-binding protein [Dactylosporangium sp. NPDC050688]|uniref:carbohydrate-binding protein n=1 Tax=Dactylosporangium sp. NPDC050688 TaxID=3157217 RepID=UPI0033E83ECB
MRRSIPALSRAAATLILALSTAVGVPAAAQAGPAPSLLASSAYTLTQAEAFVAQSGIQVEPTTDVGGGFDVGWFTPGDWIAFDLDFGATSPRTVTTRLANGGVISGTIRYRLDSPTGTPIATTLVFPTGGWQTWSTVPADLHASATGVHRVYVTVTGGSGIDLVNINWFKFNA